MDAYKKSDLPKDAPQRVSVIGKVKSPGTFGWDEKMTLSKAIEKAGGFDVSADANHVGIWRNEEGHINIVNASRIIAKAPGTYDGVLDRGEIVIVLEKVQ